MLYQSVGAAPVFLAGLLGQTLASPVDTSSAFSLRDGGLVARQHNNIDDKSKWCENSGGDGIKDWDTAAAVYSRVKLPVAVDVVIRFLSDKGEEGWLRASETQLFGSETSTEGSSNCANIGGSPCEPGRHEMQCGDYFDYKEDKIEWKYAYWAFRAMRGMYSKISRMADELRDSTLISSLSITELINDLESDKLDDLAGADLLNWMSTAIIMAGAATGVGAPVAGAGAVITGLIFARAGAEIDEDDVSKTVQFEEAQVWLRDYFKEGLGGFKSAISLAAGVKYKGTEFSDLPSLTHRTVDKDFTTENDVSRFFSSPFWLLDDDSQAVKDAVNAGGDELYWKLTDVVLQGAGWVVMGVDEEDEESCGDINGGVGRWMEVDGEHYCLALFYENNSGYSRPASDSSIMDHLEKHNFVELEDYYRGSLECAKQGNSGTRSLEPDYDAIIANGRPPCFFSAEVKWVTYEKPSDAQCSGGGLQAGCITKPKYSDWYE